MKRLNTKEAIKRLEGWCESVPVKLYAIDESSFALKPVPGKWSKKEIIGHLIDSAANNHQRFVRGQFENGPIIGYDQNNWNTFSYHQEIAGGQLIDFWQIYNKQLVEIMKRIPEENLKKEVQVGSNKYTLEFLIVDYVDHLEHHLNQVITD